MRRVYRYFLLRFLFYACAAYALVMGAIVVLHAFGVRWHDALLTALVLPACALYVAPMILLAPYQWLQLLPLRRRALLLLTFLLSLTVIGLGAAAALAAASTTAVMATGGLQWIAGAWELLRQGLRALPLWRRAMAFPLAWSVPIGSINVLLFFFCAVPTTNRRRLNTGVAIGPPALGSVDRKHPWKAAGLLMSLLFGAYLFARYLLGPATITLLCVLCPVGQAELLSRALGLFGPTKRRWITAAAMISLAEGLVLAGVTLHATRSPALNERVAAYLYLQPLASGSSRTLVEFLDADLSAEQTEQIGEDFIRRFHDGKKLSAQDTAGPRFLALIESKSRFESVRAALRLYDAKTLSSGDLTALFDHLKKIDPSQDPAAIIFRTLDAPCEPPEMVEFLRSKNMYLVEYALARARYYPEARYTKTIWDNIERYDDEERLESLGTLSIINGQRLGLDDFVRHSKGAAYPAKDFDPDCETFRSKTLADLTAADEPAMNYCIRKLTRGSEPDWIEYVERAEWIRVPLNARARWLIAKGLHLKPPSLHP